MSKRAEANAIQVFFALGDGTRLSVVQRLGKGGAQSATMLADGAEVTRQAIVKHLQVLEGAGLGVDGIHDAIFQCGFQRTESQVAFVVTRQPQINRKFQGCFHYFR